MEDEYYIKRAILLAARSRGRTSPNPMVGAVLVKGGEIIAEGYHREAGGPHAEALALMRAGENARGATLYVSLEPCCHTDKRTPPCTSAIIEAGIKRVVVAMRDPNPKVSGKGIEALLRAGIETSCCIYEDRARALNEAYIKHITTGLPFVILKAAMTLDGKIATPEGQSKWITGEKARGLVHRLRSSVDAVVTAIGTVEADDPQMTARVPGGRDPRKVIIDPDLRISPHARILKTPPDTFIVTRADDNKKSRALESQGVKMLRYEGDLQMQWLMRSLGAMGIISVLIEGGSSLNSHALLSGIVDKVMIFIAPKIIGGQRSFPVVGGTSFRSLEDALKVNDLRMRRVGEDLLIEGRVTDPASSS